MKAKRFGVMCATAMLLALAACGGGQVKRVSEPNVGISQLTVQADGRWKVDLRVDNYSSVPMQFGAVSLALTMDGESASGRNRRMSSR